MQPKKVLITGSTGFIGRSLDASLVINGYDVLNVIRGLDSKLSGATFVADISPETNWRVALIGVDIVIHSAGRVHIMNDDSINSLKEFRYSNVESTLHLANSAVAMGVKRFIFLSSIKVLGEQSSASGKFYPDSVYNPSDPYGISKMEAEIGLQRIAKLTGLEVVIIRLPLVYGPGVKANFLSMMNWLHRGIPLPFGSVTKNRRSFVFLNNLISLIITCMSHPRAANQIFLVSDDEDLSTAVLLKRIAFALGRPSRLIPVPVALLKLGSRLLGRSDITGRLCSSLQVDIKKTQDLLGWSPLVSVDEGLRQTAAHFLNKKS
jgi:nucleoside-diphosphate-sugar epimerase